MAIQTERFESKSREWLASIHSISQAKTIKASFVGTPAADAVIPSGTPIISKADGTAVAVEPGATAPALAAGDQIGFLTGDRTVETVDGARVLNGATLFHGTLKYKKLGTEAKAVVDAALAGTVAVGFEFTVYFQ